MDHRIQLLERHSSYVPDVYLLHQEIWMGLKVVPEPLVVYDADLVAALEKFWNQDRAFITTAAGNEYVFHQ
jgi:hypothetical protein